MTQYEQALDELIGDQVDQATAVQQLLEFTAEVDLAPGESSNVGKEALLVRQSFVAAFERGVALLFLPDLRVDIETAENYAQRLHLQLDSVYINADFVDSLFYLRPEKPESLAARIESALFKHTERQIDEHYFDLFILLESAVNHPDNAVLRGKLIFGIIHPAEFVAMTKRELEPECEQRKREQATEAILASKDLGRYVVETGIECLKCGKKTVTRQEKESRSADEPMSIFYTCSSCGYKWTVN